MTPFAGWVSVPNSCLSFCLLYFALTFFEENGLPFWVPGIHLQHSEVVLWKLLNMQIDLLMNLWGRKWSPGPILLPPWDLPLNIFGFELTFL